MMKVFHSIGVLWVLHEKGFLVHLCCHQVVDTPGFGDSDDEMESLMEDMMDVLNNKIGEADVILLLLKGTSTRFSAGLQIMLKRMTAIFGSKWWDNVVIGASFWTYDEFSIEKRKCYPKYQHLCRDEKWFEAVSSTPLIFI